MPGKTVKVVWVRAVYNTRAWSVSPSKSSFSLTIGNIRSFIKKALGSISGFDGKFVFHVGIKKLAVGPVSLHHVRIAEAIVDNSKFWKKDNPDVIAGVINVRVLKGAKEIRIRAFSNSEIFVTNQDVSLVTDYFQEILKKRGIEILRCAQFKENVYKISDIFIPIIR